MNQQPDHLFREKLEDLSITPPVGVWNKIEAKLDKPSTKSFWLKIAASLVFLISSCLLIWNYSNDKAHTIALQEIDKAIPTETSNENESIKVDNKEGNTNLVLSSPKIAEEKLLKVSKKRTQKETRDITQVEVETKPVIALMSEEVLEIDPEHTIDSNPISKEQSADNSISIVYSSEEVNQKFLLNKENTQATPDEKKSSTFQKLLVKVYDLKTNEDPVGKLRQKKNEILALNFKKEKRGQNN